MASRSSLTRWRAAGTVDLDRKFQDKAGLREVFFRETGSRMARSSPEPSSPPPGLGPTVPAPRTYPSRPSVPQPGTDDPTLGHDAISGRFADDFRVEGAAHPWSHRPDPLDRRKLSPRGRARSENL